ncbi:MAG: hypothetical protein IJS08_10110 [Victivallales bacterium]|nr:hypothetical protein [Victivallales bacterium]
MTKQEEQNRAVLEYRDAIRKSVEHDEQMGQYGYNSNWNSTEAERLRERGEALDENEKCARERYESLNCQETTGLSSDDYRHQVIEEDTKRRMEELREQKRAELEARMQQSNENTNHI